MKIKYAPASAAVPSAVSGKAQFAFLNAPAVLVARNNHVPVVAVAQIGVPDPDRKKAYLQLLVGGDSRVRKPADLAGRTIAVDTLYQLPDLSLRHALRTAGVDPAKVKFVEIPFPQMNDALRQGKADAINAAEPFVSSALAGGARTLMSATEGQDESWPLSVMLTSERYLSKNRDVVDRFARAIAKADDYAEQNPAEVRALVPSYTQVPEQVAKVIRLPVFKAGFDARGWQAWVKALATEKLVKPDLAYKEAFYRR